MEFFEDDAVILVESLFLVVVDSFFGSSICKWFIVAEMAINLSELS